MADIAVANKVREAPYYGLRMTSEQYFQLEDDGFLYELVDGVVCMSPSPSVQHQRVTMNISAQLAAFLNAQAVGEALFEIDVPLGQGPHGGDLVYRPDIVFLRTEKLAENQGRLACVPDLIVEVVSAGSRSYDSETKKGDYERFGVREYWLIDPERKAMTFYRLQDGTYDVVSPDGDHFTSEAVPGFVLDLARVRETFKPW